MDDFLNSVDRLFAMANRAPKAPPLAAAETLRRIRSLAPSADVAADAAASPFVLRLPVRFMIGLGSAAAALAIGVGALAFSAWRDLHDPFMIARFLPDIARFLEI